MTPYFDVRYTKQGTRITIVESVTSAHQINRLLPHFVSFWKLKTVVFEMLKKIDLDYAQERWDQFVESRRFKDNSMLINTLDFVTANHVVQQLYCMQVNEQCPHSLTNSTSLYMYITADYKNYGFWTLTKARAAELVDNYIIDTVTDSRNAVRNVLMMLIHMTSSIYSFFLGDYVFYDATVNAGGAIDGWTSLMQRTTTEELIGKLSFEGGSEKEIERKCQVYKRCWDLVLQKRWGKV